MWIVVGCRQSVDSDSRAESVTFAASKTDESAVVYSIDLRAGDQAATDKAITSALHGDWTLLENLQNAHPVRNVIRDDRSSRGSQRHSTRASEARAGAGDRCDHAH